MRCFLSTTISLVKFRTSLILQVILWSLAGWLPGGCEVTEMWIAKDIIRYTAKRAEILFVCSKTVSSDSWKEILDRCRREHASGNPIPFLRQSPKRTSKTINLQDSIETIQGNQSELRIRYRIDPTGTPRLEELMAWLGIGPSDLAQAPRRTAVAWIQN